MDGKTGALQVGAGDVLIMVDPRSGRTTAFARVRDPADTRVQLELPQVAVRSICDAVDRSGPREIVDLAVIRFLGGRLRAEAGVDLGRSWLEKTFARLSCRPYRGNFHTAMRLCTSALAMDSLSEPLRAAFERMAADLGSGGDERAKRDAVDCYMRAAKGFGEAGLIAAAVRSLRMGDRVLTCQRELQLDLFEAVQETRTKANGSQFRASCIPCSAIRLSPELRQEPRPLMDDVSCTWAGVDIDLPQVLLASLLRGVRASTLVPVVRTFPGAGGKRDLQFEMALLDEMAALLGIWPDPGEDCPDTRSEWTMIPRLGFRAISPPMAITPSGKALGFSVPRPKGKRGDRLHVTLLTPGRPAANIRMKYFL